MGLKKEKNKEKNKAESQDNENRLKDAYDGSPAGEEAVEKENNEFLEIPAEAAAEEGEPIPMVMLPAEDVERLKDEAKTNLGNWQRERADFLNYKKRIERDQQQLNARIKGDIIKKILPVMDDLERALKALPDGVKEASWEAGIDLIYRKLRNTLESEGITRIAGESFDPNIHEAISHEPSSDHGSGEIIEIVQQGYMLGDRILRPALVRVAQ